MNSPLLVLYHANCWDGFCAAWIAHQIYPDAEFVPVQVRTRTARLRWSQGIDS